VSHFIHPFNGQWIVWSQTGVEDRREIAKLIALDNAAAAACLVDHNLTRIERADELPFSNRAVPERGAFGQMVPCFGPRP
jgi:plasmid stabilization system protein ParE